MNKVLAAVKSFQWLISQPITAFFSAVFTVAFGGLLGIVQRAGYFLIPCLLIIFADLVTGIRLARMRGEKISTSKALRRTGNKIVAYFSWIVAMVFCDNAYGTNLWSFVGVGFIFMVEGISFLSNVLEPHGLKLNWNTLFRLFGRRVGVEELGEAIEENKIDEDPHR